MPMPPAGDSVVIRPATRADLTFTVRSHCRELPHGLFPLLGPPFMTRWHATFLDSAAAVALVAEDPEGARPVGFLLGAVDQARLVQEVVSEHRMSLAVTGLGGLLRRPRLLLHFLRTRGVAYARRLLWTPLASRVVRRTATDLPRPSPHEVAVVSAIAVESTMRGRGVGKALVRTFLERAAAAGAPQAQLTTRAGSDGAGRFYARLGWQHVDDHVTRDGLVMSTFSYPLGPLPTGPTGPTP
jgi:GNAT superfamily N-acetyltransferase